MANPEHLAQIEKGAAAWNAWWEDHVARHFQTLRASPLLIPNPFPVPELSGANLKWAKLAGANLKGANLSEADLSAELDGTNLRGANLSGAKLSWAYLTGADLSRANLREANLHEAILRDATFLSADMSGADLSGARLAETIFADTILKDVRGLDSCFHSGPSTIDFRTLSKSDRLPLQFLRGCGLPDKVIDYLPSMVDDPIQLYSCFISYSTKDQEFADRLYADLQNSAVRCWFAPHDIAGGRKVHEQIDEAIRVYDRLLLILSDHSMKSSWVETEISKARKRELREGRHMLFPVRLVEFETLRNWECFDADTGKDSAREIREYFIPDFSKWKDHDSYKAALDGLLRDLKSNGAASAATSARQ